MRFFILGLPQRRYSDARVEKVAAQSSREIENAEMGCGFLGLPQRRYSNARVEKVVMVKFAAESLKTFENKLECHYWLRKVVEKSKTRKWCAVFYFGPATTTLQ